MKQNKGALEFVIGFVIIGFVQLMIFISIYMASMFLKNEVLFDYAHEPLSVTDEVIRGRVQNEYGGIYESLVPLTTCFSTLFLIITSVLGYVFLHKKHKMLALGILAQMIVNLFGIPLLFIFVIIISA